MCMFAVMDSIDKANLPAGVAVKDYWLFRRSQKDAKVSCQSSILWSGQSAGEIIAGPSILLGEACCVCSC